MKKILILFLIISLKLNSQTPVNIYNPYNFLKYITVADTITSRYLFLKPQNYYPYNPSKDMIINYNDTFKIYTGSIWKLFGGSGGGTVDTTILATKNWSNNKFLQIDNYNNTVGAKINAADTVKWNAKLSSYTETDPIYSISTASKINAADTVKWNAKLSSYTETDPVFSTSVAKKVTAADTVKWNAKLSSYTETDPIYSISTASKINAADTVKWNAKLSSYTETDPIFIADSSLFLSKTKYKADTTDKKIKTGYQAILDTTKLHNEIFLRLSAVNAGSTLLGLGTASSALKVDTTLIETKADILKRFTASNFGTYISGNGTTIVSSLYNGYQKFTGSGTITGWSIQEGSSTPVSSTTAVSLYTGSTPAYGSLSSILTMNLTGVSNASATGLSIAFTAGQYYIFNVTSNSAAQYLTIQIYYTK